MSFSKARFKALHFELTNKCNLRCRHCYNMNYLTSSAPELSLTQVKKIIDLAQDIGCADIGFSGGEPFARKDFIEILEYAKKYPIHVLSNGVLIDEAVVEKLNAIPELILEIRISLDGLDSHEKIRGISYTDVLKHICLLLENDYVVTVNTMITEDNLTELNDMFTLFSEIGVDRWRLDFIFSSGNASKNGKFYNEPDKILAALEKLIARYIREQPAFEFDVNKLFRSSLLSNSVTLSYSLDSKPCEYQGSLTVRPDGQVSFCPSLELTHGNILTTPLSQITSDDKWVEFSNITVVDLNSRCHNCVYMPYCGGGCRADAYYETGSLYGIAPFTCELMKLYVEKVVPMIMAYRNTSENV